MEGPFERAERRLFAAHAEDPKSIEVDGETVPWSIHYHRRLAHFVDTLAPEGSLALKLAARAGHIRRWKIPREDYDEGRSGYKRWRSDLARFHAEQAAEIFEASSIDRHTIDRAKDILQKKRLKYDPEVQTYEDGVCLVFLENEIAEFATKHDAEKMVGIIQKTWAKMSEQGHQAALPLVEQLPEDVRELIDRALEAG